MRRGSLAVRVLLAARMMGFWMLRTLVNMQEAEAYLRALTAPLAGVREGNPLPVARFSQEAVANAFVILGLLPAARAEEILAAVQPVLQDAGFRLLEGRTIRELSVSPAARDLQEARAAAPGSLRSIPLAAAAGPVRCQLRGHDVVIRSAMVTPEGIGARYHGDPREGDEDAARSWGQDITGAIRELSITDDTGGTYLVSAGKVSGHVSGRRLASGGQLLVPEGRFLAAPAPSDAGSHGGPRAVQWLEFSAGSTQPVRAEVVSSAAVLTGTTEPPWPTPAECYLAQFAPPAREWSFGSFATGTVELDTAAIVTAVADALVAVGALPPDSAVLTGITDRVRRHWRLDLSDRQLALLDPWSGPEQASSAGLAARLPFTQATAVIETVTAHEDMVAVQLYGHPWVMGDWPMITPCFQVTAVDDTGAEHEGDPRNASTSISTHEGSGTFWFWPPVSPQAKQLRVTVSTLWEAAWALIDIPGR
jgi:hypothetical protein